MATDRFSSTLMYKTVKLCTPPEVVQHSFIVQNSISHLDLELSQSYRIRTSFFGFNRTYSSYNRVINTEEKCQKLHSASRRQLYNLHLDLPKAREWSLKQELLPTNLLDADLPCLARVEIDGIFFIIIVASFLDCACENTFDYKKVLKWFMKLDDLRNCIIYCMPLNVLNHFVDGMLIEFVDLEFVKKCLRKLPFKVLLKHYVEPARVGVLLDLVHRKGGRLEHEIFKSDFSNHCFLNPSFKYVGEVLKFQDAPHLSQCFIDLFMRSILNMWRHLHLDNRDVRILCKRSRRCALLLHLYWTYLTKSCNPSAASESLRLVWNAVPDSFINKKEITDHFASLDPEEKACIYDFYSEAVGENHDDVPRSLQHHCRSTIRRQLWKGMQWLPQGIEQLGLPTSLQSYLKLERQLKPVTDF